MSKSMERQSDYWRARAEAAESALAEAKESWRESYALWYDLYHETADALAEARKERDEAQERADDLHTACKLTGEARDNWRKSHDDLQARYSTLRAALRQIKARAQAIPENPIANDIEDIARAALSEQDHGLSGAAPPASNEPPDEARKSMESGGPAESDCTCQTRYGRNLEDPGYKGVSYETSILRDPNCPVHGEQDKGEG